MKCPNIVPYRGLISREKRQELLGQRSRLYWLTGLSGSGKSTIAHQVEERLFEMGRLTYVFDGDNVRKGLCSDLNFTPEDRAENIRRISEMVKLFLDAGVICLTSFVSPMRENRQRILDMLCPGDFYEIYIKCPVEVCTDRDAKGLYKLALEGKIPNFTGVSAPYEEPENPDLVIESHKLSIEESVQRLLEFIARTEAPCTPSL